MAITLKRMQEITGNKTQKDLEKRLKKLTGKPYSKIKKIRISSYKNLKLRLCR
jgi:hypothetical protein